ncbi:hypothetical protein MKZ38_005264 [Zalerion maritima]|uniref:RFX-type winged-helix domain-containing protein n=1 Tax=Zalerion maritima TaxID=339359 RepID=A0AAD5WR27_9PEZI|nr:hypothetical protein MKZ38_005264 [Zalerion maritima]
MAAMGGQSRKRPLSRASTASAHSVSTQPLEHSFDHSAVYQAQWINDQSHASHGQVPPQMSPEDMQLLQAATQLQAGSLHSHQVNQVPMQYAQHAAMPHHPLAQEAYTPNHSFTEHDTQMMDREEHEDDSLAAPKPVSKGPRSSANNELEMRQLFSSNKHRHLQDVATELHGNERGPNSERTRQVFAMLWINKACAKGEGSVPRGRVYANYANKCANERITVLNPASFGKLVRVLFPGLKTRRLGVRGESKYHYVKFMLLEDQVAEKEAASQPTMPIPDSNSFSQSFNSAPAPAPALIAEPSVFPSPEVHHVDNFNTAPVQRSGPSSRSVYNQPNVDSMDQVQATTDKTAQQLSLSFDAGDAPHQSDPIVLPNMEPFLPQGTDPDAVKSLTALYRSHCTSLVECIRYCKEKTFFHLFTSFQGTLTMPVQKLFTSPAVAPWIEECDFILYQKMMRIISGLTLQVVPKPVLDTFRNISERLVPHLRESFHGQPSHVIRAKEPPAAIFSSLLDRALRVNLTAHAAANMLANPANRDQMYLDWIMMVRVKKVAECVPTRGMDDTVNVLLTELRTLLEPQNVPLDIEALTVYGDASLKSGSPSTPTSTDGSAQTVLDRWTTFLRSLPGRFHYASHTDIMLFVERVGSAVMRDLTINQGKSFGSWWVTKCWVDEMVAFMAEQGGFMKQKSSNTYPDPASKKATTFSETPQLVSRQDSVHDLHLDTQPQAQPDRAPFPVPPTTNADVLALQDVHDDSGIGIRTPEEDFPIEKFEFHGNEQDLELDDGITHGT